MTQIRLPFQTDLVAPEPTVGLAPWVSRARSAVVRRPRWVRGPRIEKPVDAREIRTERLVLRRHRLADAQRWAGIQSHTEVRTFLNWPKRDLEASRQHLRDRTRHARLWQTGDFLALAIELDGRLVGDVSLHLRTVAADKRSAEIGWLLDPAHSGHGYATEAARAMLDVAFTQLRARSVIAEMDCRNTRSIALASRLGFRPLVAVGHSARFVTARG